MKHDPPLLPPLTRAAQARVGAWPGVRRRDEIQGELGPVVVALPDKDPGVGSQKPALAATGMVASDIRPAMVRRKLIQLGRH